MNHSQIQAVGRTALLTVAVKRKLEGRVKTDAWWDFDQGKLIGRANDKCIVLMRGSSFALPDGWTDQIWVNAAKLLEEIFPT